MSASWTFFKNCATQVHTKPIFSFYGRVVFLLAEEMDSAGMEKKRKKPADVELEMEVSVPAAAPKRKRRRRLAFQDRRRERRGKAQEKKEVSEESEVEDVEEKVEKEVISSCEDDEEVREEEGSLSRGFIVLESSESEEESEEEAEEDDWVPSAAASPHSNSKGVSVGTSGDVLGAILFSSSSRKSPKISRRLKKVSSLDELVKGTELERTRREREKKQLEVAGWEMIREVEKWKWNYYRVPPEAREMMVSLPPR